MYTPYGEGLCYLILLLLYFCLVSYKVDDQLPILWKDGEEMLLLGMLPSQIYKELGRDFYIAFNMEIKSTHYFYLKETYWFTDEQILRSQELNNSFVL
jgi:hypothetical protein